jgi:hypothetical protein
MVLGRLSEKAPPAWRWRPWLPRRLIPGSPHSIATFVAQRRIGVGAVIGNARDHIGQGDYTHRLPLMRQLLTFNAYSEGWRLYTEQLADEAGAHETDPVAGSDICDCLPCVPPGGRYRHSCQTRWTREQAVRFLVDVNCIRR